MTNVSIAPWRSPYWGVRINWTNTLNNKSTIDYIGFWESINNPDFKTPEFGGIRMEAGTNRFYISVNKFVEKTGAIGIFSKAGRYGGTYAHKDIAYNFGMWLSPEFYLLVVKELQRLKAVEQNPLLQQWDIKRIISTPRPLRYNILHKMAVEQLTLLDKCNVEHKFRKLLPENGIPQLPE